MGQPSVPPPAPGPAPPPPPGSCQVRCAGCHWILTVGPGMKEFSCPKCQLPQMLPPELMAVSGGGGGRRAPPPAQGIDPTKIQLPCARCKALLNVPHGLSRFNCPQCGVDLAVDLTKLHQYFSPLPPSSFTLPPGMLPGESLRAAPTATPPGRMRTTPAAPASPSAPRDPAHQLLPTAAVPSAGPAWLTTTGMWEHTVAVLADSKTGGSNIAASLGEALMILSVSVLGSRAGPDQIVENGLVSAIRAAQFFMLLRRRREAEAAEPEASEPHRLAPPSKGSAPHHQMESSTSTGRSELATALKRMTAERDEALAWARQAERQMEDLQKQREEDLRTIEGFRSQLSSTSREQVIREYQESSAFRDALNEYAARSYDVIRAAGWEGALRAVERAHPEVKVVGAVQDPEADSDESDENDVSDRRDGKAPAKDL